MAFSKNDFMAIIMMFLFYLNIVGAPDDGEGTSSSFEVIDYENIQISSQSQASACMSIFKGYCGVPIEAIPSTEACAKHGLLYWPRFNMRNTPPYVIEYFNKFSRYLIAGEFLLPYEFCYREAQERKTINPEMSIYQMNDMLQRCYQALISFRSLRTTMTSLETYSAMGLRQQIRQDILQFAFYETNINMHTQGSPAASCLFVLEEYCGGTTLTMEVCALYGLMNWPKGDDIPDFVEEYFNNFSPYLIAGNFQLPYEFCYNEARIKYSIHPDVSMYTLNDLINRCLEALIYFRSTPTTIRNFELFDIAEFKQQMRQDVLQYAFYETNLSQYTTKDYGNKYLYHISNYFQVYYLMESPKTFCMKKFSYADNE